MKNINYEKFFQHSLDMCCVVGFDGKFQRVNPAFEQNLGYAESVILKRAVLDFIHPEDRKKATLEFKALSGPRQNMNLENRLVNKYGAYRWLSWTGVTMSSEKSVYLILRDITEQRNANDQLRGMGMQDDLTGLYNRRGFFVFGENYLNLSEREKKLLLLMRADLIGTKKINRKYGHQTGDVALIAVAQLLQQTFRKTDIVARLEQDEFAMLALLNDKDEVSILVHRLQEALRAYNAEEAHPTRLELDVHMSYAEPGDSVSITHLLSKAGTKA